MRIVVLLTAVAQVVFATTALNTDNRRALVPGGDVLVGTAGERAEVVRFENANGLKLTSKDGNCQIYYSPQQVLNAPFINANDPLPNWLLDFTSCLDVATINPDTKMTYDINPNEVPGKFVLKCHVGVNASMTFTFPKGMEFTNDSWKVTLGVTERDQDHPDWPIPHVRRGLCMALYLRNRALWAAYENHP